VLCVIVIGGQGWGALTNETIKWHDLAVAYIGVPVFLAFYLGYKYVRKTKVVPLTQVDLSRDY
jgi:amino acid permease